VKYILFLLAMLLPLLQAEDITGKTTVNVGVYDYEPFMILEENGTYNGIYADILKHIAEAERWQINFVHGSWEQGFHRLQNAQIDLLTAISQTPERRKLFEFNREPILTNRGQVFKQKGIKIETIADLRDKRLAVYKDDVFTLAFKELLKTFEIECMFIEVSNYESVFKLINEGQVEAGIANNIAWVFNRDNSNVMETPIIFLPTELLFASPKSASNDYLSTIDKHLVKLKADRASLYYQTIDKWTIDKLDIVSAKKRFPSWGFYIMGSAGGIILLFIVMNLILKHKIRQKTEELFFQNKRLKREIIKRKQASEELSLNEKKLESLMDNLPGMVYRLLYKNDWGVDFVSKGSIHLLGYHDSHFHHKDTDFLKRIIHPEDYQNFIQTIQSAGKNQSTFRLVYRVKMKNGLYKWISDQGKCEKESCGRISCEGFMSDITQQQEMELQLLKENIKLRSTMKDHYKFGQIIGKCEAMQQVYEMILKASSTDESVSISGETGTGKELIAKAIHEMSDRRQKPFVVVNCSAIPETLIESEFFGHIKGAFTGAYKDKKGVFDLASGGTLFLDEIGDISLNTQVKLLRAIELNEYSPVGSGKTKTSDVRIVTASHKNLKNLVKEGQMREDFYYRINVIPIRIPPLRERKEDIPLLVEHFMSKLDESVRPVINGNIMEALLNYDWPGNVRELQNRLNRFAILKKISLPNLPAQSAYHAKAGISMQCYLDEKNRFRTLKDAAAAFEKTYIEYLMNENHWHRGQVSEILNVNRRTLFRKLKAYSLKDDNDTKYN
jgi:transcriptional regulator with PAS, ATPase and Fis domain/ABC-type amino acid transport substrate-binding protein